MIKYSLDKRFYLYMKELCEEESVKITDISTILYSILLEKRLYDFAPNNISRKDIHIICDQMKNIFPSIKKRIQVKKVLYVPEIFLTYFYEVIATKEIPKGLSSSNEIYFCIPYDDNEYFLFCVISENGNCYLSAESEKSVGYGLIILDKIIDKFEIKLKEVIDQDFKRGKIAFRNYFISMLDGLYEMVKTIEKKKAEMLVPAPIFNNYKILRF